MHTAYTRVSAATDLCQHRDYEGGFGSPLMLKDLGLALAAARVRTHIIVTLTHSLARQLTRSPGSVPHQEVGASLPLGANAHALYGIMCSEGYADKDFSSVFQFLDRRDE